MGLCISFTFGMTPSWPWRNSSSAWSLCGDLRVSWKHLEPSNIETLSDFADSAQLKMWNYLFMTSFLMATWINCFMVSGSSSSLFARTLAPLSKTCCGSDPRSMSAVYSPELKHVPWASRLKIALGVARGLAYLHHGCNPRIIHRDVSASNVLLDEDLDPRLSDFGLAKLIGLYESHLSLTVGGTFGYVAPGIRTSHRSLRFFWNWGAQISLFWCGCRVRTNWKGHWKNWRLQLRSGVAWAADQKAA